MAMTSTVGELDEFSQALARHIKTEITGDTPVFPRVYRMVYELCFALATSGDLEGHLNAYAYDPPTVEFLRDLAPGMSGYVEWLGGILENQLAQRIRSGQAVEVAIQEVADWHRQVRPHHLWTNGS